MSRRTQTSTAATARKHADQRSKRVSMKDGSLAPGNHGAVGRLGSVSEVKDGESYYKTTRIYPAFPDYPEDVMITVARMSQVPRAGSSADSRRGSVMSDREGTESPNYGDRCVCVCVCIYVYIYICIVLSIIPD
jgi:hypothetical protein